MAETAEGVLLQRPNRRAGSRFGNRKGACEASSSPSAPAKGERGRQLHRVPLLSPDVPFYPEKGCQER